MDGCPHSGKQTFIALSAFGAETNMSSRALPDKPVSVALPDSSVENSGFFKIDMYEQNR